MLKLAASGGCSLARGTWLGALGGEGETLSDLREVWLG